MSYVTLPSLLIYSKTMSQETSALSYFLYKLIIDEGVQGIFSRCCDRAKNVLSFDGHQL